ncbi:uncharacterized protein LOC131605476 [Vicia villosa]|uniref:uncharacterized protein LOC131605476 n=1 Tax=Vicia villosa TaxID=3911 RepID=UPI00273CDAE1|nr:uncharacterized protein LOC131605476 [Vicia villosa]
MKLLKQYGFNSTFCNWILCILKSAFLSISVNGSAKGYFNCTNGVRQGDPLSPLLFCLAEDVLSRHISNLVLSGQLETIKAPNNVINCAKSSIFGGAMSSSRMSILKDFSDFMAGLLPVTYLSVPLFKGRPKVLHLQPIADKIISKLASWKGALLSFAGRIELVKSTIQSMLTHSMSVYSWPTSLLRDLEGASRNFIWSGDTAKRKIVTVDWKNICKPISKGGLGIRSFLGLNEATNLRLCWDIFNSKEAWTYILKQRILKHNRLRKSHLFSSLWTSAKSEHTTFIDNSVWQLGNGEDISFWFDHWCGSPLFLDSPSPMNRLIMLRNLIKFVVIIKSSNSKLLNAIVAIKTTI